MHRASSSEKGSAILIAITAVFAVSLAVAVVGTYYLDLQKAELRQSTLDSMTLLQEKVAQTLSSDSAWQQTLNLNAGNAPSGVPTTFYLYDASGAKVFNYKNFGATNGFTNAGELCNTFAANNASDCPMQLNLTWQTVAECQGSAGSFVQITTQLVYTNYTPEFHKPANYPGPVNIGNHTLAAFCRPLALQNFYCTGPAPGSCTAPSAWYCTSTGWRCGQIYN